MSDFDTVLERLLGDAGFQAALARDPAAALRGYNLTEDEREVLRSQLVTDAGGHGAVETRTSKSGLVGLFAPIAGAVGMAAASYSGNSSIGSALPDGGSGGGTESLGLAAPVAHGAESIGSADGTGGESLGSARGSVGDGFGSAIGSATDGSATIGGATPPGTAYHTSVDVNGDGHWDGYVATPRAGGGYDVVVDMDHDGRADFIGHDVNGDGLIDSAEYDTNLDGRMDTRMYDDNGDGWLDRSEQIPPGHNGS
jgi:hypothetical protein